MRTRTVVAAALATVVVAVGAQGAAAAERPSLAEDIAARLGISVERLQAATKAALIARIDAAIAAGKLTPERGAAVKERIANADGLGLRALRHRPAAHRLAAKARSLGAAAEYLGLTRAELRAELHSGKSLAQVASSEGKTVDGLVAAMLGPAKDRLDKAVASGKLTRARADELLDRLEERLEQLVQKTPKAKS